MSRSPGIYTGISNSEYHKDKEWKSSSQLKVALISAYDYKYFVIDGKGEKKESDAKDFGTLVHLLILEPHLYDSTYAALDMSKLDLRRKTDQAILKEFKDAHPGKIVISEEDYKNALTCRDSVLSHQDAKALLDIEGPIEASCYVVAPVTLPDGEVVDFKMRYRPDKLGLGTHQIDLKTSKSSTKYFFEKDAFGLYGYHYDLSAYMYTYGEFIRTGKWNPFYWIRVKNDHPFSASVFKASENRLNDGKKKFEQAVNTIVMSQRSGKWEYQPEMEEI
jgi:hypothetical protein